MDNETKNMLKALLDYLLSKADKDKLKTVVIILETVILILTNINIEISKYSEKPVTPITKVETEKESEVLTEYIEQNIPEYNIYSVCAILGNFYGESCCNPGIWESLKVNAPGYGLGQWTDVTGVVHRRSDLFSWLESMGYSRSSGNGQLEYLLVENYWIQSYGSKYKSLREFLYSESTDIEELTTDFFHCWEGINDSSLTIRKRYAWNAYNFIKNHKNDKKEWKWISGNRFLNNDEFYNNCMVVYNWFFK